MGPQTSAALLVLVLSAPALSRPAVAQTPPPPKDSAPKAANCEFCVLVFLAAGTAVLLVAPSSLLLVRKATNPDTIYAAFARNHVTAYVTGGGGGTSKVDEWTHSQGIEVLRNGIYGEARVENLYVPERVQFQTVRAGYLAHPKPALVGGVTLGYRIAHGDGVQNALEIGLPLVAGAPRGSFRFEPTYLISTAGVTWNYRWQIEFNIPRRHLIAGFNVEAKPLRQGDPYLATAALVLGVRY